MDLRGPCWRPQAIESYAEAVAADADQGVRASVVLLKQGEKVHKELGFGLVGALLRWNKNINAVLIEVAYDDEGIDPGVLSILSDGDIPFVLFGAYETVQRVMLPHLATNGREDVTVVAVNQSWAGEDIEWARKETWLKSVPKAAILGGWPLATAVHPFINNLDMRSPPPTPTLSMTTCWR